MAGYGRSGTILHSRDGSFSGMCGLIVLIGVRASLINTGLCRQAFIEDRHAAYSRAGLALAYRSWLLPTHPMVVVRQRAFAGTIRLGGANFTGIYKRLITEPTPPIRSIRAENSAAGAASCPTINIADLRLHRIASHSHTESRSNRATYEPVHRMMITAAQLSATGALPPIQPA